MRGAKQAHEHAQCMPMLTLPPLTCCMQAYMVTVWSTSLELTSGSSAAPAAPEAVDNSRNARRRRRRERRGGDIVSHCPDLLLVGRRRLSEVFYMHLQVVTSEFLAAQKAGTTKGRNPFKSLPSYDPSLSLYIRTKSLTLARRIGGQVNGSELIQSVRKKLMAMEHLQAKLIEDSSAANRCAELFRRVGWGCGHVVLRRRHYRLLFVARVCGRRPEAV